MTNFYVDVISKDPRFHSIVPIRDVSLLEPATRAAVAAIIVDARAEGIELEVTETFRSQALQLKDFDEHHTQLRNVGVHGYGLAADFCKLNNPGGPWAGDWTFLCRLAAKHGLICGGDWGQPDVEHDFIDSDHVQRIRVSDQENLFAGTWYPDESYNPYST